MCIRDRNSRRGTPAPAPAPSGAKLAGLEALLLREDIRANEKVVKVEKAEKAKASAETPKAKARAPVLVDAAALVRAAMVE
eukprot:8943207-Pyramimonas_sp.AAC.1